MRSGLNRRVWNTVWNRQSLHLSARTPICVLSHILSLEHAPSPGMAKATIVRQGLSWLSLALIQYEAYHVYARACEWEKQRAGIVSGEIK